IFDQAAGLGPVEGGGGRQAARIPVAGRSSAALRSAAAAGGGGAQLEPPASAQRAADVRCCNLIQALRAGNPTGSASGPCAGPAPVLELASNECPKAKAAWLLGRRSDGAARGFDRRPNARSRRAGLRFWRRNGEGHRGAGFAVPVGARRRSLKFAPQ